MYRNVLIKSLERFKHIHANLVLINVLHVKLMETYTTYIMELLIAELAVHQDFIKLFQQKILHFLI